MKRITDRSIIEQLQRQILQMQGSRQESDHTKSLKLGHIESAFPDQVFPRAAIHELISYTPEAASCTNAFISLITARLIKQEGCCLWIATKRTVFPAALKLFGLQPERILFVDSKGLKDALWIIEEALKCNALTAVIGEISELDFNESRRLQLVVEKSKVTGFIHRYRPKAINAVACVSRWQITPVASEVTGEMPGLGFPRWKVQLSKVKNGSPSEWLVQWSPKGLEYILPDTIAKPETGDLQIA